ncbi:hypothetical protein BGZ94_008077 [Podila epigama]|nr:hypothetical protein BGZ94_008077 [Podila epigama]
MSSTRLPTHPQTAHLADSSFQHVPSTNQTLQISDNYQYHEQPQYQLQQHQQQQEKQQHQQPYNGALSQDTTEIHGTQAGKLIRVNRAVELATHGIQAFISLYAIGTITSTMRFQAAHHFTSLTAMFLFLVAGISSLVAMTYILLAWWARTPGGLGRIQAYLGRNQTDDTTTKQLSGHSGSSTSWMTRVAVALLSPRPRLCIILGMFSTTLSAAILQHFKIRNASNCGVVPVAYQSFCRTTKAAVASTFLSSCFWGIWFGYWFYMVQFSDSGSSLSNNLERRLTRQRHEILITMPEDEEQGHGTRQGATTAHPGVGDMAEVNRQTAGMGPEHSNLPGHHNQLHQQLQQHQQHQHYQQQHNQQQPPEVDPQSEENGQSSLGKIASQYLNQNNPQNAASEQESNNGDQPTAQDPNSLGLGIEVSQKLLFQNPDQTDIYHPQSYVKRAGSISGASVGQGSISSEFTNNSDAPERSSRTERMRDHAKIFPRVRSSTGSICEPYSNRNTPQMNSRREMVQASPAMSPSVSTPTTPLSRGNVGYISNHTLKSLNTLPRSASMGYIAVMNASSAAASAQASPLVGASSEMDFACTPLSARSQRSMSFHGFAMPQTQAELAAAEQSMDEHLKALRRRSFAAEAMSPVVGGVSHGDLAFTTPMNNNNNNNNGSNNGNSNSNSDSCNSPSRGSFRMSFSTPNLANFRRKSSLGLKSVLTSLVGSSSSQAADTHSISTVSTSSSVASSPRSILSQGREAFTQSPSQQSVMSGTMSAGGMGGVMSLSAQDLLQSEYGDIFASLQKSYSALALTNPTTLSMQAHTPANGGSSSRHSTAPSIVSVGRPRSGSFSSVKTSSSGTSSSAASTMTESSNQTSFSNEDKFNNAMTRKNGSEKAPGPPLSFMNRVMAGSHHANLQTRGQQQQQQQQQLRRSGSGDPVSEGAFLHHQQTTGPFKQKKSSRGFRSASGFLGQKKFSSQGDLSQYSWDYRKEVFN